MLTPFFKYFAVMLHTPEWNHNNTFICVKKIFSSIITSITNSKEARAKIINNAAAFIKEQECQVTTIENLWQNSLDELKGLVFIIPNKLVEIYEKMSDYRVSIYKLMKNGSNLAISSYNCIAKQEDKKIFTSFDNEIKTMVTDITGKIHLNESFNMNEEMDWRKLVLDYSRDIQASVSCSNIINSDPIVPNTTNNPENNITSFSSTVPYFNDTSSIQQSMVNEIHNWLTTTFINSDQSPTQSQESSALPYYIGLGLVGVASIIACYLCLKHHHQQKLVAETLIGPVSRDTPYSQYQDNPQASDTLIESCLGGEDTQFLPYLNN